ncbi:unnamed protein product [Orchesella dallaii]|uniref:Uncharacterized protein n=1 Tax=Orchesella dallaii TaxID=48710 RepID=A0ABP1R854_9HEXA
MKLFLIFSLSVFCFGVSFASDLPPFSSNLINATATELRKLGCDVDLKFQQEGMKVKILCELEHVMTWLDTWLKPLLITTIFVAIFIGILVVLCCIRLSNCKLACCRKSSKCVKEDHQKDFEESDTRHRIPLVLSGKENLKQKTSCRF